MPASRHSDTVLLLRLPLQYYSRPSGGTIWLFTGRFREVKLRQQQKSDLRMKMPEIAKTPASWQNWSGWVDGSGDDTARRGGVSFPTMGALLLRPPVPKIRFAPVPRDVLVQCPKCKTMETLQFIGPTLLRSRKFHQRDGRIFHDCGSDQPCRLHI